ncbi:MAG: TonB-dependent receptor plug domain-containing protein [Proteobacteria bacterium]|uniref:TonB-dependent receptor n=1 Tax=Rudaea sp. TaxID=2136325 RepID=UPI00321F73F9|nr:TonB-dependent receptor plug domain-containing protein [Pseudomonadota bacterium]
MKGKSRSLHRRNIFRRKALALAIGAVTFHIANTAWAQATSGTIYGTVPAAAGEMIQITGGAGFNRSVEVDANGRYSITLPVGTYTVTLLRDGKVVDSRKGVSPVAAGAVAVDFAAAGAASSAATLNEIKVLGQAAVIDVSTTNQVTTITAKQLQLLPIARTAEDIAMLAPGVNMGSPELIGGPLGTPALVFGGASTAENAYYVDGMNTTELLNNQGGIALPYGSIEQQQTFISGYDARYGRSIGGVVSQIGKSGSNEWHFGARASWQPGSLREDPVNYYYANPLITTPGSKPGDLAVFRKNNNRSETIYDAYASGPIIEDRLFFFVGVEQDNTHYRTTSSFSSSATSEDVTVHDPKVYAKINWNINDANVFSLTGLQNEHKTWGTIYDFDYDTRQRGDFNSLDQTGKTAFRVWVANYTSYLTDNLTLNATFGKMHGEYYTEQPGYPGFNPSLPHVASASNQDPAFAPPGGVSNSQTNSSIADPNHRETVANYRVSLDWKWRSHDFQVGIDNINSWDLHDGSVNPGTGYQWIYGTSAPGKPVFGVDSSVPPFVAPSTQCHPDSSGKVQCYYVQKHVDISAASMRVAQRAAYIMDNWQVTPNLLLNLGLRDDAFVNYDGSGAPYIRETKPQWAPRLGFSWDVHGDSSLKLFGNAGRYYLALPTQVALSIAAPVTNAGVYGTYTGINPTTGEPIGFTPLPQNPTTGVSIDSEYGQAKDPRVSAAQNIKAEFSDNFVFGMQQQFDMLQTSWTFGATATYQRMNRIIDDVDAIQNECAAGRAQGYAWMTPDTCDQWAQSLVLMNPGVTNKLLMKAPDGSLVPVTFTAADQGFPRGPKRRYYSIDLSLEHAWDSKWFAKIDYVFSRTWGNTEGPVSTYSAQSGSYESLTTAWDFPERMEYSDGVQPNDRRHQLKVFGAYALTTEWTLGGNMYIASGTPRMCRGRYGPDQIALHGSNTYYWCGGKPVPPGSLGRLPWNHQLNLNVDYRPDWADRKLDFNLAVFNVFDKQVPLYYGDSFRSTSNPRVDYGRVLDTTAPRYVRLSVAYDF